MENAGWKPRIMTLCHVHTKTNKPRARFFTLQASVTILMLKLITKQLEKDWTNSFKGLPGDSLFSLKRVKQQNLGFQCLGQIKLWLSSIMCLLARFPLFVPTLIWLQQITAPSWVWFFLSKMCFFLPNATKCLFIGCRQILGVSSVLFWGLFLIFVLTWGCIYIMYIMWRFELNVFFAHQYSFYKSELQLNNKGWEPEPVQRWGSTSKSPSLLEK